jgi:hypothetical protein
LFRYRLSDAIAEVERELTVRRSFYSRVVSTGQMSRLRANNQLGRLEAARDFLIELKTTKGGDYELTSGGREPLAG